MQNIVKSRLANRADKARLPGSEDDIKTFLCGVIMSNPGKGESNVLKTELNKLIICLK